MIRRERPAFCSVKERPVALGDAACVAAALARYVPARKRLERFALRLANRRPTQVRRLLDGIAWICRAQSQPSWRTQAGVSPDPRVYRRVRFQLEPPALLLLLDLSESLNAVPPGAGVTLLELAQSASALLATSLASLPGDLAIHGFSSNGRHDVGYLPLQGFRRTV